MRLDAGHQMLVELHPPVSCSTQEHMTISCVTIDGLHFELDWAKTAGWISWNVCVLPPIIIARH